MNIDNQHGKVLPIVLVFSILAQLLGGYFLTQAVNNRQLLRYEQIRIDSNYLTEAAFQFILSKLADDKSLSGNFMYSIEQIINDSISVDNGQDIEDGIVTVEIYQQSDAEKHYVKIAIVNVLKYRMIDFDVEHSIYAIVDVETLAIMKRDWYDFTLD